MSKNSKWYESKETRLNNKLETIIMDFPYFARDYITVKRTRLTTNTLVIYAYTIQSFLNFLLKSKGNNSGIIIHDLKVDDMKMVGVQELKAYEKYLQQESNVSNYNNSYRTIAYKFSILKGLYNHMRSKGRINQNPFDGYKVSGRREENDCNYLSVEEVQNLFQSVIDLSNCKSEHQAAYLKKSQLRDYTILLLILNTGIRVSECQGLDIQDIDFSENRLEVARGRQNQSYVYFNDKVCDVLRSYLLYRKQMETKFSEETALFLSMRRTRISIRAIQKLVSKVAAMDIKEKSVTPRMLRNTYGVELYKETKDVQLVGAVLGCPTNAEKYAEQAKPNKRNAANAVTLSERISESKG